MVTLVAAVLLFAGPASVPPPELDKIITGDFAATPGPANSIRIVDWNIDRGTHLDQVGKVLESDRADLCLLQEVDVSARRSGKVNTAEELARQLKMRYAYASAWQELSQGNREEPSYQGQAILTGLPMKNVRVIRFEAQSTFWKPHVYVPNLPLFQRRLGGRIAIVAELELAGRTIVVYNLHLESRSTHVEELQLQEILDDTKRYPADTPIILAGDLNTKYDAGAMGAKLRELGWRSALGSRAPKTHKIMFSLDWILVHGPLQVEGGKVEHGTQGSDHMPVVATISIS